MALATSASGQAVAASAEGQQPRGPCWSGQQQRGCPLRAPLPQPLPAPRSPHSALPTHHSILRLPTGFTIVYGTVFFKWIFFLFLLK